MGSIIEYFDCPKCDNEAFSDFYYKTGEEYVICNYCGYRRTTILKRDDSFKLVTKDGTDRYEFDNLIMEHTELESPYCAYRLKMVGDVGVQCGSCENVEQFCLIKEAVEKLDGVEIFSYSRLVEGQLVETILINNSNE